MIVITKNIEDVTGEELFTTGVVALRIKKAFSGKDYSSLISVMEGNYYETSYLGVPQINWGVRNINLDEVSKSLAIKNKWNKILSETSFYRKYIDVMELALNAGITVNKLESLPVVHSVTKPLPKDTNGAHADILFLTRDEIYRQKGNAFNGITYLRCADYGGRLILHNDLGDSFFLKADVGDMVIFNSKVYHDVEYFKTSEPRISVVCQYKRLEDGTFYQYI